MQDDKTQGASGRGRIRTRYEDGDFIVSSPSGVELYRLTGRTLKLAAGGGDGVMNKRQRISLAEANAGVTILAAIPGFKYRIVSYKFIAIGGAAAGGTSLDVIATQGAVAVRPFVVPVALLTRSRIVDEDSVVEASPDNLVTILADGASHKAFDANTAITVGKQSGGSNLTTATDFDVLLSYVVEEA